MYESLAGKIEICTDCRVQSLLAQEGKIIGVDSGDPQSHEDYRSPRRKAFNGLSLAIVQSTGKPGQIRVTAASPGLKSGSVTVMTKG